MRTLLKWLVVILAVVAAGVVLKLTLLAPQPVSVEVVPVEEGIVEETVTNTRAGTVKARLRAALSPQVGGLVIDLPHREGDRVEAGALLLRLDDKVQQAQVRLAEAAVVSAGAAAEEACLTAELAEKELQRVLALHRQEIASEQLLDAARTDRDRGRASCEAARSAVDQVRAEVAAAQVQVELTRLHAPFAGVVAELSTELGEWITPSPPGLPIPPVLDLLDTASIFVSAPIDEIDSERVEVGQAVRLTVDSRPGLHYSGSVVRVASYVLDELEQNRTVEVEAEFDDPEEIAGLLVGTSADVEVILSRREGVLRVPTSAVADRSIVLVLEAGRLEERTVTVGLANWQFTEVLDGLNGGDLVVTVRDSTSVAAGALAEARDR